MKIFKIDFMMPGERMHTEDYSKEIWIDENMFYAKEEDLDELKQYGEGFKKVEYVGELYESKTNNIVVNITANLVNKEEVEKMIDELNDKLKNMKVTLNL